MSNIDKMYGHLVIDGVDAYSEYGFIILKGSMESWLLLPEMKNPFSHDWKDENGLEVDLDERYAKSKDVTLKVLFIAETEVEFWENYKRTLEKMTSPGLRTMYYREMDKEFEVYYTKSSAAKTYTRLKNVNKICVEMTFHFTMPDPTTMVERLVAPTEIALSVDSPIIGVGTFTYAVAPSDASRSIRATITPISGNATVTGSTIRATAYGTVRLRVESALDSSVYDEKIITVYPDNIIYFADGLMLEDGYDYITAY